MRQSSTRKLFGRVLILAALGAGIFTGAMLATNFYIQSGALGMGEQIPGWVYIFMQLQDMPYSLVLRILHLSGSGGSEFCVLASMADGLAAFVLLLISGFIWQLFKSYEEAHKAVA